MNTNELVDEIHRRCGVTKTDARKVLRCLPDLTVEALGAGDRVVITGFLTLTPKWREPRALRSIHNQRKMLVGGRVVPVVRTSKSLRRRLAEMSADDWRDPAIQKAWRVAETLVADLDMYHGSLAPQLADDASDEAALTEAAGAFGALWSDVVASMKEGTSVDQDTRERFLARSVRQRWTS